MKLRRLHGRRPSDRSSGADAPGPGRRRVVLAVAGGLLALALVAGLGAVALGLNGKAGDQSVPGATEGPQLNVIVLVTDDQDVRSLRWMKAVRRRIQGEGTTFTNSFATYPLCCPSRATHLTGQYAHNHGVTSNRPPDGGYASFVEPEGTLPESLQGAGYRTGYIGRYLNGYGRTGNDETAVPPGWDEWWGFPSLNLYRYPINHNGEVIRRGDGPGDYQTDVMRDIAGQFLRDSAGPQPFFLTLATLVPHTESIESVVTRERRSRRRGGDEGSRRSRAGQGGRSGRRPAGARPVRRAVRQLPSKQELRNPRPAPRHSHRFENLPLPRSPSFNERDTSDKPRFIERTRPLDEAQIRDLEERHQDRAASLLAVDELVTALVEELRRTGELDETVIVYTSDNGYLQGEHRRRKKGDLYEESARVPLVIRGPGFPAGAEAPQIVGNVDLAPTILDIADAEPGRVLDGRSLLPLASDSELARDRAILLQSQRSTGVRVPGFAYYRNRFGGNELYDLERDPFQLVNLIDAPAYARLEAGLSQLLEEMRDCAGEECLRGFGWEGELPAGGPERGGGARSSDQPGANGSGRP